MKLIGGLVSLIFLPIYGSILNGWALTKLWSWFMVKTFELPKLSIPAAIGLCLIVSYLTADLDAARQDTKDAKFEDLILIALTKITTKCLFALLVGFIVKQWI